LLRFSISTANWRYTCHCPV